MKKNNWIVPAMILGTVFFLAVWIIKPIGVSTQFSVLSGIIHSAADPSVIDEDDTRGGGYRSTNAYYDKGEGKLAESIKNPVNYDFVFVLAIPLGAYGGFLLKRKNKAAVVISKKGNKNLPAGKRKLWKQYIPSFLGGFLLLYGARMADGCTSGHMMSGMMQGAASGYIFAGSVFAAAIPIAIFTGRRIRIKGGK